MNTTKSVFGIVLAALIAGLTACGSLTGQSQPPSVKVIAPASGTSLKLGEAVAIQIQYGGNSVAQIQIKINGTDHAIVPVKPEDSIVSTEWTPEVPGNQVIYLEARDANKTVVARSDLVFITVEALPATVTSLPATATTLSPSPTTLSTELAQPQSTPIIAPVIPAATTTPLATLAPSLTTANEYVNLRSGPSTAYDLVGRLNQGQTATVIGKSSDGQWWQITLDGKTAWVIGELVQANESANGVAVAQAPASPTPPPATPTAPLPTATTAPVATLPPPPTVIPADDCNPSNPFWAAKLNNNPDYTFCTPVPFEFVLNASPDPDELVIRWHIYGIQSLELRMDPSGDSCGRGSTGFRQQVPFKQDNFRINRRDYPTGGYKLGLWATLKDGRVQDWGELHFCGK